MREFLHHVPMPHPDEVPNPMRPQPPSMMTQVSRQGINEIRTLHDVVCPSQDVKLHLPHGQLHGILSRA